MLRRRAKFDTCRCRVLLLFSLHTVGFCYSMRPPTARQLYKADGSPTDADCRNEHTEADCNLWASKGECDANVGFMRKSCARACVSCGWVDSYCSDLVRSGRPAKRGTGTIAAMFEYAATRTELGPRVHSSPATTGGPWVVTFDNFLSEGEADAAARAPNHQQPPLSPSPSPSPSSNPNPSPSPNPEPSPNQAEAFISSTIHHFSRSLAGDVVSPVRTSQQAWCQVEP
eukprot:scaffold5508_cov31-Phaeocystis_antarctica.AAC.1